MGLLDSVIGSLGQPPDGRGGGQAELLKAVLAMLTQGGSAGLGGISGPGGGGELGGLGGLGGLVERFTRGGLGDVVGSWVGTGSNLPVSSEQIGQVLGPDVLGQLARQLGLGQDDVAGRLSQMLPQVVDRLTPHGELPEPGADLGDLASLGDIDGALNDLLRR
ncbi:MAG: DUF937 domain-containing protein [Chitinophagaceae bacterium]|nr:DUF937 domain-containing protein [Rubrivivax sp.]